MPVQKVEALFDFQPTAEVELQMKKGDVVLVRRMSVGEGWWEGELRGKRGLFPSSFVKLLAISEQPVPSPPRTPPPPSMKSTTKAPLTPRASKKAFMETLLTPAHSTLEHVYDPEKAAELFVPGHTDIAITLGPRWDCRPPTLTIVVKDPHAETKFSGIKQFTVYEVETKELSSCVSRKYKQFLWLYDRMAEMFPCISLPPLPVKQFSGSAEPEVLEVRRRGLERFLNKMATHPLLGSTKRLHDFLTAKDDKDWKIGRVSRVSKSFKKLFGAPIYCTVKYPPYNVPLNQLASIEKFERFSRLLEMNVNTIQHSCEQLSLAHGDVMLCVDLLGRDWQRFAKGMPPTTAVQRRKLVETRSSGGAVTNGQSSFYAAAPHTQRTAAELETEESGDDNENIQWNWREDNRFSSMVKDLHDVATGMRRTRTVYQTHHDSMQQSVVDMLREYSGVIHTLPILVRLHEEAMEAYNTSREKDSKKDAEIVRENCETLNNVLLAEFDHFSNSMVDDFQNMITRFLKQQADFHRQVASDWDQLHARYVERTSRHQNQSGSSQSSPLLTKRSTQSTTSSDGSCGPSTISLGRDHESIDSKPPPPPTTAPPPSVPPPPTNPPPPSNKPSHNTYVNLSVLPRKDGDDLVGSWDGSVTVKPSNKEDDSTYEVPFKSMRRSKSQEIFPARDEEPCYENWQAPQPDSSSVVPQSTSSSRVPLPSDRGKMVAVKKPMPIRRKAGATKSTEVSGRLLTEPKAAGKNVPLKPNPPPKPKGLEQPARMVSPPHYSQVMGSSPHSRPMSDIPVTMSHLAKLTSLSSTQEHLPLDRKPRSNTTANLPSPPERKQPLLPPPLKLTAGSKVPSPSRSANKPPETIPEMSEDSNSVQWMDAGGTRSLQSSWEQKAPAGLRSVGTAMPKDPPPTDKVTSTATRDEEGSRGNELMRKLSKRREILEHELTPRRHRDKSSPAHATNCPSECSSTSSSHSELLVSYSEKRTDEPVGGEAPVVTRTNQVKPEEGGNLAKFGIIEDVAGGSYVI